MDMEKVLERNVLKFQVKGIKVFKGGWSDFVSLENKSLRRGGEVLESQDFTISEFYRPFIID